MKQITTEDFDNAVKQPHNVRTCILAQYAMRIHGVGEITEENFLALGETLYDTAEVPAAGNAMRVFDNNFRNPGDENMLPLQNLRASLPITIEE